MKKTMQINMGGAPFTIDDDAYRRLDAYMLDLKRYFTASGNQDDIMTDIEARIAELFSDLLKTREIVEITDVEATIRIMGTPTDFADDTSSSTTDGGPWDIKTGKRLFRNPEDKVIGGVCSGLAAYFGIAEVLWVRLAFVVVFLTMGFGIVVYLIMWAMVPEAKTAADRLTMMGEQANAKNIARMVERGVEDLSTTIKHNWKEWRSKKKSRRSRSDEDAGTSPRKHKLLLVTLFVPVVIVLSAARFLIRVITRSIGSRKWCFKRSPYV